MEHSSIACPTFLACLGIKSKYANKEIDDRYQDHEYPGICQAVGVTSGKCQ